MLLPKPPEPSDRVECRQCASDQEAESFLPFSLAKQDCRKRQNQDWNHDKGDFTRLVQDFQLRTPPLARFAFPAIGAMGETNWTAILNAVCVLTADTQAGNTLQPSATEKDIAAASGDAVYWRRAFARSTWLAP